MRAGDNAGVVRRLQPFMDNDTVAAITVTGAAGAVLFSWHRDEAAAVPVPCPRAPTEPVRTFVENIPGAVTPDDPRHSHPGLDPGSPVSRLRVGGRLEAANAQRTHLTWLLSIGLARPGCAAGRRCSPGARMRAPAAPGGLPHQERRAHRPGRLHPPRRGATGGDALGELQQALERMRGRLRQSTINKNYLHSVLNSMTDAVFVTSPDGVIRIANDAACKLLGYARGGAARPQHHRGAR